MNQIINVFRTSVQQSGFAPLIQTMLCVVGMLVAAVNCFFGYKYINVWLNLFGILFGLFFGFAISITFVPNMILVQTAIILLSGVGMMILVKKQTAFVTCLLCGVMSALFFYRILPLVFVGSPDITYLCASLVIGFICALLTNSLRIPMIIVITSIGGGYTAAATFFGLVGLHLAPTYYWLSVMGVCVLGMTAQICKQPNK